MILYTEIPLTSDSPHDVMMSTSDIVSFNIMKVVFKNHFDRNSEHAKKTFLESSSSCWLNHPLEKYARQIGSSPQVEVKIKNL